MNLADEMRKISEAINEKVAIERESNSKKYIDAVRERTLPMILEEIRKIAETGIREYHIGYSSGILKDPEDPTNQHNKSIVDDLEYLVEDLKKQGFIVKEDVNSGSSKSGFWGTWEFKISW